MDYVSGTSDAALDSSCASDVSLHQTQRQREGSSPSAEQLGLKTKFCTIHQPRGPAAQPWEMLMGATHPTARPGAAEGPAAAALALQTLLQGSHLSITLPTLFPATTATTAAAQDPGRWQEAAGGGRRRQEVVGGGRRPQFCPGPAPSSPAPSLLVF